MLCRLSFLQTRKKRQEKELAQGKGGREKKRGGESTWSLEKSNNIRIEQLRVKCQTNQKVMGQSNYLLTHNPKNRYKTDMDEAEVILS